MRHPFVMGNWKLNGSRHMVHELVSNLRKELAGVAGCAVAIAPPEMYIDMAKREAEGSHIMLGAQNVDLNLSGAFTGETSAAMLKDIGAQYIIIGHSERRTYHKESAELIAKTPYTKNAKGQGELKMKRAKLKKFAHVRSTRY